MNTCWLNSENVENLKQIEKDAFQVLCRCFSATFQLTLNILSRYFAGTFSGSHTCHNSCEIAFVSARLQVLAKFLVKKLNSWKKSLSSQYFSLSRYFYLVRTPSSLLGWCLCNCARISWPGRGGNSGAGQAPDLTKFWIWSFLKS